MGNTGTTTLDHCSRSVEEATFVDHHPMYSTYDVTFVVGGKCFNANWQRTCAISPKFQDLLESSSSEMDAPPGKQKVVYIDEDSISPDLFDMLLRYSCGFDTEIRANTLWPLRMIAVKYGIDDLRDDIDELLVSNISFKNFSKIYAGYSKIRDRKMQERCIQHLQWMQGDPIDVFRSKYFRLLRMDPDIRLLLQCNAFDLGEGYIWRACVDWARGQQPQRISEKLALRQFAVYLELGQSLLDSQVEHIVYSIEEGEEDQDLEQCSLTVVNVNKNDGDVLYENEKSSSCSSCVSRSMDGETDSCTLSDVDDDVEYDEQEEVVTSSPKKVMSARSSVREPSCPTPVFTMAMPRCRKESLDVQLLDHQKRKDCLSTGSSIAGSCSPSTIPQNVQRPKVLDFANFGISTPLIVYGGINTEGYSVASGRSISPPQVTSSPLTSEELKGQLEKSPPRRFFGDKLGNQQCFPEKEDGSSSSATLLRNEESAPCSSLSPDLILPLAGSVPKRRLASQNFSDARARERQRRPCHHLNVFLPMHESAGLDAGCLNPSTPRDLVDCYGSSFLWSSVKRDHSTARADHHHSRMVHGYNATADFLPTGHGGKQELSCFAQEEERQCGGRCRLQLLPHLSPPSQKVSEAATPNVL